MLNIKVLVAIAFGVIVLSSHLSEEVVKTLLISLGTIITVILIRNWIIRKYYYALHLQLMINFPNIRKVDAVNIVSFVEDGLVDRVTGKIKVGNTNDDIDLMLIDLCMFINEHQVNVNTLNLPQLFNITSRNYKKFCSLRKEWVIKKEKS